MATTRPFAYNPGSPIPGTQQVGNLAIGIPTSGFGSTGLQWWNGADEDLGYVICRPIPGNTQPTHVPGVSASVGFLRTSDLTDQSFIDLVNTKYGHTFSTAIDAKTWLNNNGYWTSYILPLLSLDAGNPVSYPGSGTTWTDIINGLQFTLSSILDYDNVEGSLTFDATNKDYAYSNTSLANVSVWTVEVWHYYTGINTGPYPTILTEFWPGVTAKINFSLGSNYSSNSLSAGFFDNAWRTSGDYTLTPNNWYHIVGTYDGSTIKLYVNNLLVNSNNYSGTPISTQGGIRLMRRWDDDDYWGGKLAVVNIYDKALLSNQITSLWNLNKNRFGFTNITFTITPSDFAGAFGGSGVTNNGTLYFINSGSSNTIDNLYVMTTPQGSISTTITNTFTNAGMNTSSYYGYLWNVSWGPGSTNSTLVRMSWNSSNGQLYMSPINPAYSGYLSGQSSPSLAGTFNFPATFTAVQPAILIASNSWC